LKLRSLFLVNETFDYVQYLDVKKGIDDSSLNKNVWALFSTWLRAESEQDAILKVLEIGAGIGTMIERLLDASLLHKCHYMALEPDPSFKTAALDRLQLWASNNNCGFKISSAGLWLISNKELDSKLDLRVEWIESDADSIDQLFDKESFDLLLSHAVIDLLPVPEIMPVILEKLRDQGGYYFSLNFSGETEFYPSMEDDIEIAEQYHADMDSRFPKLDWRPSMTGSTLPKWLESYGCEQVVDGESNWSLGKSDQLFIRNILDTIKKALYGFPKLDNWLAKRYKELEQGDLKMKISNRDCFGLK